MATGGELVKAARRLLFLRDTADGMLSPSEAALEIEQAELELEAYLTEVFGHRPEQRELEAALIADGLDRAQAGYWAQSLLTRENHELLELTPRPQMLCANCGSGLHEHDVTCRYCSHPRGAAPSGDTDASRASRLVRMLVATGRIELVTPRAEAAVAAATAEVLGEHAEAEAEAVARALEEAWIERDDIAEVFASGDEIRDALARVT